MKVLFGECPEHRFSNGALNVYIDECFRSHAANFEMADSYGICVGEQRESASG